MLRLKFLNQIWTTYLCSDWNFWTRFKQFMSMFRLEFLNQIWTVKIWVFEPDLHSICFWTKFEQYMLILRFEFFNQIWTVYVYVQVGVFEPCRFYRFEQFILKIATGHMGTKGIVVSREAVVHLNFRAGSTFPVPVFTESPGHWVNKADTQ